jgi:hypothetical protein
MNPALGRTEADLDELKRILESKFDLRQRVEPGKRSFHRLWQTIEIFDPFGEVVHRNQWRGDFQRTIESVDESGKAEESISWHSVGVRFWLPDESKYGPHKELDYSKGFSYSLSIEDDYNDLDWNYSGVPKSVEGSIFRQAFQVSAHFEFDFMRSVKHAGIDQLQKIGDLISRTPEEGHQFSLSFPPIVTNSLLERRNVHIGFLGLNQINGEPCAILYYRQGPQKFSWDGIENADITAENPPPDIWHKDLTSWQQGHFCVRLKDGTLAEGEFSENHMIKRARPDGTDPTPVQSRGIWSITEISKEDYSNGLQDWYLDQSELPWHGLFREFRGR